MIITKNSCILVQILRVKKVYQLTNKIKSDYNYNCFYCKMVDALFLIRLKKAHHLNNLYMKYHRKYVSIIHLHVSKTK
jgi:hypothetical protein